MADNFESSSKMNQMSEEVKKIEEKVEKDDETKMAMEFNNLWLNDEIPKEDKTELTSPESNLKG